ncbi:substrate-binding domain of hmg-CoA reductase [Rhizoclosmatium globosum]|uniref:hydroxymethylglutaryl-CoA reductase (NADPH) n=1 Tax=Rhizoclosmatium globosum TaxID=329046 RepID=A0A1Y2CT84_9FUNG|nr:substrate-binding domain of hmg-CoA reductase [Rhizoclosmatium globosum]|eukprot:ORY50258.1 substrate-binding domain of hmg-CoA reductase [Rhizoclosmatium globosum]
MSTVSLAGLNVDVQDQEFPVTGLDEKVADNMIENCIGTMGLPVGLALNFVINGKPTVIPMVVEEPSVVAAVSGAAKTICCPGSTGFVASTSPRNITYAQVSILDVPDVLAAADHIRGRKQELIDLANSLVPNMLARGGGVVDVTVRTPLRKPATERKRKEREVVLVGGRACDERWLVVHLHLDVCDAMGANAASTVSEGVAPFLAEWVKGRIGIRIVSNLATERMVRASFRMPLKALKYKNFTGRQVATRMLESLEWAQDDPFRSTTHNKGIMNGIDAVAVATGQDWRAIEAAAHAWASGCGAFDEGKPEKYTSLTNYWVEGEPGLVVNDGESEEGLFFCGEIEMPMSVGTKGGVLKTNPVYQYLLGIMGHPDSKELAMGMAAIGLAQNFAAMRALSTEGIQRGHMSLHARNIAIAAGAPAHAINECVAYMVECNRVSVTVANEYLAAHEIHTTLISQEPLADPKHPPKAPSTFYIEATLPSAGVTEPLTLNIAFETLVDKPVHLLMNSATPASDLSKKLFNPRFDFSWITSTLSLLDQIELSTIHPARSNRLLVKKLKLLSVLMNMLLRSMVAQWPSETRRLVDKIVRLAVKSGKVDPSISRAARSISISATSRPATANDSTLQVGRPLLLALWQVFELRVLQWVGHEPLAHLLLETQLEILQSLTEAGEIRANNHSPLRQVTSAEESGSDDEPLMLKGENKKPQMPLTADQTLRTLYALIEKQSKRFQTAQFLLCDTSSHDPNLLPAPRLRLLKSIGDLMAWEQMCAHDICASRLGRDLAAALVSFNGDVSIGEDAELEHVTKDGNGFVFWLTATLTEEGVKSKLADSMESKGVDAAVIAWVKGQKGGDVPSKKQVLESVLALDLHELLRDQIFEFVKVSSKEEAVVKLIQEESLEIFHKDTLLGISNLYRQYYGVEQFFVVAA